jgi:hypothetical protein
MGFRQGRIPARPMAGGRLWRRNGWGSFLLTERISKLCFFVRSSSILFLCSGLLTFYQQKLKGAPMPTGTINLSEEQLAKLIDAYKTIKEFLASALSPNELYCEEFLAGLRESDDDIRNKKMNEVRSLDDFVT